MRNLPFLSLGFFLLLATAAAAVPESAPEPAPDAITARNLLENERSWPYIVALKQALPVPPKQKAIRAETRGVLIRITPDGLARIDFGRHGVHEVPVAATDVVAAANDVRAGLVNKLAPNFALEIGNRLADPATPTLEPFDYRPFQDRAFVLCVFADTSEVGFGALAAALAPVAKRHDVQTILFPRPQHDDDHAVRERLRELDWLVPFVVGRYSGAYTGAQLAAGTALPAIQLQTNEGRVLYSAGFDEQTPERLESVLARAANRPESGDGAPD